MARIRSIKPDFFCHEGVAALNPLARLAFIGLWCHADRKGRLEDRPRRLKVQILPYDEVALDALLAELNAAGFIERYEIDGQRLIQVCGFLRHQRPAAKEVESLLPAPPPRRQPADTHKIQTESGTSPVPTQREVGRHPDSVETTSEPSPAPTQHLPGTLGREGKGKGVQEEGAEEGNPSAVADGDDNAAAPPRKRGRRAVAPHPDAAALCSHLVAAARTWKSDVRVDGASTRSLGGMDALLRIDRRDPARVRVVLDWLFTGGYAPHNEFDWRPVTLSGASLRKHWDQVETLHNRATGDGEAGEWTGR